MGANQEQKALLLAIGNSARGDDGLGWALATILEQKHLFRGDIFLRFQLQIEDAELCAHYPYVFFVDAWKTDPESPSVNFQPCTPAPDTSFTTHAVSPQAILQICQDLYAHTPEAYLLLLKGASWELGEGLSPEGEKSLREGCAFFDHYLTQNPHF